MTDKTRRQVYVLAALVAVLGILVYVRWSEVGSGPAPSSPAVGAGQASNQAARGTAPVDMPVTDVRLEALQRTDEPLRRAARNPFRFEARVAASPPRAERPTAPPPQAVVPAPAVPAGPPPPPPIPLRYIGLLGTATQPDRVAVLSDARGNPFYGKEGDIIEGRYRVLRIAPDSVDVAYADGRGRQTLRLSAQ